MKNFTEIQKYVENYCIEKKGKTPDSWNFDKLGEDYFFIEKCSGKKRYGLIKKCENCDREFLARKNWSETVVACSNFCGNAKKKKSVIINCSWCNKEINKNPSRLKNSKHGFHFCNRECKEHAQSVGGIVEIQPSHYFDGYSNYANRAYKKYGYKCIDCEISMKALLQVHHIDGDRENGDLSNLEVVCVIHHMLRHMRLDKDTWIQDYHFLTPRENLDELRKLIYNQQE